MSDKWPTAGTKVTMRLLIAALMTMLLMLACTGLPRPRGGQGDTGAQGPQGEQGPHGLLPNRQQGPREGHGERKRSRPAVRRLSTTCLDRYHVLYDGSFHAVRALLPDCTTAPSSPPTEHQWVKGPSTLRLRPYVQ